MTAPRCCTECHQDKPLTESRRYYGKWQRVCAACRDEWLRQNRNRRQREYWHKTKARRKTKLFEKGLTP